MKQNATSRNTLTLPSQCEETHKKKLPFIEPQTKLAVTNFKKAQGPDCCCQKKYLTVDDNNITADERGLLKGSRVLAHPLHMFKLTSATEQLFKSGF